MSRLPPATENAIIAQLPDPNDLQVGYTTDGVIRGQVPAEAGNTPYLKSAMIEYTAEVIAGDSDKMTWWIKFWRAIE
jgi:hypothetical protein